MAQEIARTSYFHYFDYGLDRYIDGVLLGIRRQVFATFMESFRPGPEDLVLDVGVSADDHPAANYFEKHYPHSHRITAVSNEAFPELEEQFPGLAFQKGDGRSLPFADGSFDWVYSHAVIEHVGSTAQQRTFVRELMRVARKGVLFTTPNRWHPIETHTGLPLLHFLPPWAHRPLFRLLGKEMYATEDRLNLLSVGQIMDLCRDWKAADRLAVSLVRWLGFPSNIVVTITKTRTQAA